MPLAFLSRTHSLDVPLPPDAVLSLLAAQLRGAEGPMLDRSQSQRPALSHADQSFSMPPSTW